MILIECEQGSAEWHRARAGCITASMFGVARSRTGGLDDKQQAYVTAMLAGASEGDARAVAGYKTAPRAESIQLALQGKPVGQPTEAALNYAFNLAVERIAGEALDNGFETWQMRRGHELEPMARMEHEMQTGLIVQRAGFVTTDDGAFGASADGLIGEDGGSEYKCFIAPTSSALSISTTTPAGLWTRSRAACGSPAANSGMSACTALHLRQWAGSSGGLNSSATTTTSSSWRPTSGSSSCWWTTSRQS